MKSYFVKNLLLIVASIYIAGCFDKEDDKPRCGTDKYEITGSISGIDSSHYFGVILVNDAQKKVTTLNKNGAFTLNDSSISDSCYADGYEYKISIYEFSGGTENQPYNCEISNGVGVVENENISNVVVSCEINSEYSSSNIGGGNGQRPDMVVGQPNAQCKTFENPSIYPSFTPPMFCGSIGGITQSMMNDMNSFWGAQMHACSCGNDFPSCSGNAVVLGSTPTHQGFSYIYYDANFLGYLQGISNSFLTPAWLLSHEAGHNIQSAYSISFPSQSMKELSSDCFSGYFLGNLVCNGKTTASEIENTLNTLCQVDNGQSAFFDPAGHGSCQERRNSITHGVNSYLNGVPPLNACL